MSKYKTFQTMVDVPSTAKEQDSKESNVVQITSKEHRDQLVANSAILVIDNYADWCGPCKQIHPKYDALSLQYPHVLFAREDFNDEIGEYPSPVTGLPTFHFYKNSKFLSGKTMAGADINALKAMIESL